MTLVQECAPAPASVQRGRRPSLGKGASMLFKRASSLTRSLTRFNSTKNCRDEPSDHSETMAEGEDQLMELCASLKVNILRMKKAEGVIRTQVESNLSLALVRYTGGGNNKMGAILSMRKAHKNKHLLEITMTARVQLHEMRRQVKASLKNGNYMGLDPAEESVKMRKILEELSEIQRNYTVPSDEEILEELQHYLQ